MSTANSILIISDVDEEIQKFQSKLMLLRDIDSITSADIENAVESCRACVPDVLIMFVHNKDERVFEVCKAIKLDSVLKSTPILFIVDNFDEEFILSSFDAGISDYVVAPPRESEMLMRVIWALQKSENARNLEKKNILLSELNVIDSDTGAYQSEFIEKVFANEINTAQRYKYPISLMAIEISPEHKTSFNDSIVSNVIKKSIRNSDILGKPEDGKYYIVLPKTRTNGINTVYERIKSNLGTNIAINVSGCEALGNYTYEKLYHMVNKALEDSIAKGTNKLLIVKSKEQQGDWLDKVQESGKNYKFFKQIYNKKIKSIIAPIFHSEKNAIFENYGESVIVNDEINELKCTFSLRDVETDTKACLTINDPGFSKVIIDLLYTGHNDQATERLSLDLQELNESTLKKVFEKLIEEFTQIVEEKLQA